MYREQNVEAGALSNNGQLVAKELVIMEEGMDPHYLGSLSLICFKGISLMTLFKSRFCFLALLVFCLLKPIKVIFLAVFRQGLNALHGYWTTYV